MPTRARPEDALRAHDHARCVDRVMAEVETLSDRERLRLTPVRRRVLEILLESHRALGAYDILDRLAAEGTRPQPPVAYRALAFLQEHGLVHKIERLNAYVACMHPLDAHVPAFMVCRGCRKVAETAGPPSAEALDGAAQAAGFRVEHMVMEAEGLCPACAEAS
jgi:Fur family zinc uptake transcriptional regulator